jgi:hypothetical protein
MNRFTYLIRSRFLENSRDRNWFCNVGDLQLIFLAAGVSKNGQRDSMLTSVCMVCFFPPHRLSRRQQEKHIVLGQCREGVRYELQGAVRLRGYIKIMISKSWEMGMCSLPHDANISVHEDLNSYRFLSVHAFFMTAIRLISRVQIKMRCGAARHGGRRSGRTLCSPNDGRWLWPISFLPVAVAGSSLSWVPLDEVGSYLTFG